MVPNSYLPFLLGQRVPQEPLAIPVRLEQLERLERPVPLALQERKAILALPASLDRLVPLGQWGQGFQKQQLMILQHCMMPAILFCIMARFIGLE